ncbi:PadR family transcriptional regulator [Microbispora cellulosiformans]|uniref:PadR family transcriptional regulator n=1 Tax=Microbispora cellulosiformans TaxID=2614688 RepID=A0A5J5K784_9ACTN|nr:PadR family transcriptional regulator [Microbispora cellulosiformans]KAA9379121.1 PadR family transcriptional regulator [Microbispora cellulosiformans]
MAGRRKVNNLLGLAVLSTVVQRPMHPYEMATLMRARGKDRDMGVKWGSLYTVVRNLEKHGFLEVEGTVREGAHPERTIYRITDAGRAELADWVRDLIADPEPERPRFEAALSVCGVLPPDELTGLLRRRLALLEEDVAAQREALAEWRRETPRLFLVEAEYDLAVREAEAAWIRSFVEELTSGAFPDLPMWRAWHESGRMPPEMAELAERGLTPD